MKILILSYFVIASKPYDEKILYCTFDSGIPVSVTMSSFHIKEFYELNIGETLI